MCDVLGYSRQAYYKQLKTRSEWLVKRNIILDSVNAIRQVLPKTGTIKLMVHCQNNCKQQGIKIGRDKTFDLLREQGLLQRKRKRTKPQTTWSNHWLKKHPDLIKNQTFSKPNQLWVSDITYLPTLKGWCYLFLIMDAISRKIVGYHVSRNLDSNSAVRALQMALNTNTELHGLIHHSDRGIQYCRHSYIKMLNKHDISVSMTQSGNPYDNAKAERINGTIKNELIYPFGQIVDVEEAKRRVQEAVSRYNNIRLHQNLSYNTPNIIHLNCKPPNVLNI